MNGPLVCDSLVPRNSRIAPESAWVSVSLLIAALLCSRSASAQAQAPYWPQPTPSAPAAPGLQPGGLTPPPAAQPQPIVEAQIRSDLERAEREDSGRGLEFLYANAEVGVSAFALQALGGSGLLDGDVLNDGGAGLGIGAGIGARLLFVTAGARVRYSQVESWDLLTVGGELGWAWPLGSFEPAVNFGAGYALLDVTDGAGALSSSGNLRARGFNVRAGGSLDYFVNPLLSLGVRGDAELLALGRKGLPSSALSPNLGTQEQQEYSTRKSSVGLGLSLVAVVGLHY
jgi:hypothetical protein